MIEKGEIYKSVEGLDFEIIGSKKNVWYIIYCKEKNIAINARRPDIIAGKASLYVLNRGYINFTTIEEFNTMIHSYAYAIWRGILARIGTGCYTDVSISKDWECFNNFYKFHLKWYRDGYVIDKDLLSTGKKKVYSEDTCCYMPSRLNNCLVKLYEPSQNLTKAAPNGDYKFTIQFPHQPSLIIRSKSKKEILRLYKLYRTIRVRDMLSLCKNQIRPEAVEKIFKLFKL